MIMKKVFMSLAIAAMMVGAVSCGNNNSKKAEQTAETCEEVCEKACEKACEKSCGEACGECEGTDAKAKDCCQEGADKHAE